MSEEQDAPGVQAEIVVAGFVREGDPQFDPDFLPMVISEFHRIWLDEALVTRGIKREDVQQALIILAPAADKAEVRINDEADFVVLGGRDSEPVDPSKTPVRQITNLWADDVDPDSAWSGFVQAHDGRVAVFDFRRYRERVGDLVARARQFLRSAQINLDQSDDQLPPAVEDLHAAAELAVLALALLEGFRQSKNKGARHGERIQWLANAVRNRELPSAYQRAFERLGNQRDVARYAERPLDIDRDEASRLLVTVADFVDYAQRSRE